MSPRDYNNNSYMNQSLDDIVGNNYNQSAVAVLFTVSERLSHYDIKYESVAQSNTWPIGAALVFAGLVCCYFVGRKFVGELYEKKEDK